MEIVLLKSSVCLLTFIAFYKVFLEQTSNHQFKRFYLLGVVFISIAIPFITFIEYIEPQFILVNFGASTNYPSEVALPLEPVNYLPMILWSIYGFGVLLFSFRFVYNLAQIVLKIKRNPKQKTTNFISVLLQDLVVPHTFFSYIFLNKTKFENNEIPKEVLLHEQTHALQKHSADILFIEVLQIIFWFHPLVYLLKKDIKLNHEFLADQAVINQGIESTTYQKTLLSFSSNQQELTLEHAINYSSIKKRFTAMKTQTSKQTIWFRSLLLLPVLAILIFSFSTKKVVELETTNFIQQDFLKELSIRIQENGIMINGKKSNLKTFKNDIDLITKNWEETDYTSVKPNVMVLSISQEFLKQVEKEFSKTHFAKANQGIKLIPPPPVNQKQIATYNTLAEKYNKQPEDQRVIKLKDIQKLEYLYSLMSEKQKAVAEPYPILPPPPPAPKVMKGEISNIPPPPPPKSPLDHVIDMAKKGAIFYFDGKKITSDEAIALLKENDALNISSNSNDGVSTVKISTKGITIDH